jgi:predicted secreted protein
MTLLTGIVVYILVWWVTLFAILPLWVTPAEPGEVGHGTGAPQHPHMLRKLALTTVVASVIWLGIYLVVVSPWLSFRNSGDWPSGDSPRSAPSSNITQ